MKNKPLNYYKISTIVLLVILCIFFVSYYVSLQQEEKFIEGVTFGQENAVNIILKEVSDNGYITIQTAQGNVTLISANTITTIEENTLVNIINQVSQNGFVTITTNQGDVRLIPVEFN